MTSNDGFSVVAPTIVRKPRSTKGRNASCCALLKRWTSSTNRMVCRPDCASAASACATASRMSLTPASTAEMERKSALNASAISRASVVLPVPGGPQRIIECGLPEVVVDLERDESFGIEAEADFGERGFLALRRRSEPFEAVGGGQVAPVEGALDVILARKQRRGRRPERLIVPAFHDLIEVSVVDPDAVSVAHQQLLVRLVDG